MDLVIHHLAQELHRIALIQEAAKKRPEVAQEYIKTTKDQALNPKYEEQLIKAIEILKANVRGI